MTLQPTMSGWHHVQPARVGRPGRRSSLDAHGRRRVAFAMAGFALLYGILAARLVTLGFEAEARNISHMKPADSVAAARPDIVDRNGEILATDIKTASLYAEPRRIIDPDEAAEKLMSVLPDLDPVKTRRQLASDAGFIWLKREITPRKRAAIHNLGIPGVGFLSENRRFYPGGPTASHIVGHVNVDNEGIAGIENFIDGLGLADLHEAGFALERGLEPVRLSVDLRVQHALRDELARAIERYTAIAGVGVVMDVRTGEVLGMSSLPDYDPNEPATSLDKNRLNRASVGVYEMGSTFKMFTTAMALDSGLVNLTDSFDATKPLRVSSFTINDFHGKGRWLTVPEIFIYSSNIGTARMAMTVGIDGQKAFLEKMGLLSTLKTELPEAGAPIPPQKWSTLSSMTISFGHGISVSPLQTAVAAAALVNGGYYIPPTFMPRTERQAAELAHRVVKTETSDAMRSLMRLNVQKGSGRSADVPGYFVGGKTGTAEKVVNGRYSSSKRRNVFLSAFPMDDPRYLVLVLLDEPNPEKPGISATAGRNAAPTVAGIVRRIAPMLGIQPRLDEPDNAMTATAMAAIQ
ncbi:MAG TPA: penicillin-binding protein 2 [Afifellaceae bacterium]|nr:penicillin-binding protein 2 [Afifellaceae bacterium]